MKTLSFICGKCIGLRLILLSIVFIGSLSGQGQTFNNHYGRQGSAFLEVAYSIELMTDTLVSFFFREDGTGGTARNWYFTWDLSGQIMDSGYVEIPNTGIFNQTYNGLNPDGHGGFVMSGFIAELLDDNTSYDTHFGAAIRVNHELDTLWIRKIGDIEDYNVSNQARACANGDYIFVGNADRNQNLDIMVARFDSEGNHLWTKYYSTQPGYEELGFTIVETAEGDFIIGGYVQQNINQPNNHLILKINSEGDLLNYQIIGDWSLSIGWPKLEYCSDGNFIYCGSIYPSSDYEKDAYFCKIDSDLNIIWESQYPLAHHLGYMFSIKENPDGSFISVGGGKKENGQDEGILVKLDSQGEMLWHRRYQQALEPFYLNYLYDVVRAPDGGYVAGGTCLPVPQGTQIWLLKVDSMGCLVPGCDTLVNVFELEKNLFGFQLYPNPASDVLNIYFESLSPHPDGTFTVYNLQGQAVHSFHATSSGITYILQVTDLPQGMYVLEYTDGEGVKMSKKWVKG